MQKIETNAEKVEHPRLRSEAPVFVLGCPRSGTTLLYHMLLSAGNFAVYRAESQVFNLLEPRFGDLRQESNRRKLLEAWEKTEIFRRTGLDAAEITAKVMAKCRNGGDFLRILMESMAVRQGVERWADCTPEHLLYLHRIKQTIPDALIVHIIRDGRDVALSLEKQGWIKPPAWQRSTTLEAAALYWDWIVNKGMRDGSNLGSDYVEVRFEDLVANPVRVLNTLSAFIDQDLDYKKIMHAGIGSVSEPNSSFSAGGESGGFSPVGRWMSSLNPVQCEKLNGLIGETLQRLGYSDRSPESLPGGKSAVRERRMHHFYWDLKLALKKTPFLSKKFTSREMPRF